MDLAAATRDLYARPPGEFVAARTAAVKAARAAGDREGAKTIGALRKPSLAAATMNALVRTHPGLAGDLTDLGRRMRAAQSTLDAATLAGLRPERDDLIAAVLDAAGRTDPPPSSSVLDEVRQTLVASLADSDAERVATSGRLTRALAYAGFGPVDLDDAHARVADTETSDELRDDERQGVDEPQPQPDAERPAGRAAGRAGDERVASPVEQGRAAGEATEREDTQAERAQVKRRRVQASRRQEEDRQRRIAAGQAALDEADRAQAAAQLAAAEAESSAVKARGRVEEFARLLAGAESRAREAEEDLAAARAAAAEATSTVAAARKRLERASRR